MRRQRGFTLIETAIVVAVVVLVVAAGAFTFARKPYALRSSAALLDSALARARALAETSGNGATLVVTAGTGGGSALYIYRGRPNDPAGMALDGPAIQVEASVTALGLGALPYAFFVDGSGSVRATGSYPPLTGGNPPALFPALSTPPPCVATLTMTLTSPGASEPRTLTCSPVSGS